VSLVVEWQGREYDVDPSELSQRELDLIHQKTGLGWTDLLVGGVRCNATAIRALFWVVDRRADEKITFSDFDGPPMRLWIEHLAAFKAISDDLGKQITAAIGEDGLDASPSAADTPPTSSTD
jgi:hypothetical protein